MFDEVFFGIVLAIKTMQRGNFVARCPSVRHAALALALLPACGARPLATSAPSAVVGQAVSLVLPSDTGALVSLPLDGAKATVIDAWAPTCVPCREKVPALIARRAELEDTGAKLVLVAVLADEESTEAARTTLASWGVVSPFLIDRGDLLRRECGVESLPSTLIMDDRGVVRWVAEVGASAADIAAAVRAVAATSNLDSHPRPAGAAEHRSGNFPTD